MAKPVVRIQLHKLRPSAKQKKYTKINNNNTIILHTGAEHSRPGYLTANASGGRQQQRAQQKKNKQTQLLDIKEIR